MSSWNYSLFLAIHQFAGRSRLLDGVGVFFADTAPYILVLIGIYFIFRLRGWRRRIFGAFEVLLAELISAGILTSGIRHFYLHPRPFTALGFTSLINETASASFPSRHTVGLFAMSTIIYCLNRKWGRWLLGASFLVGLARIFVGVHWPMDILGGIFFGVSIGALVHWLVAKHWVEVETAAAEVAGTDS